ncbi:MAG: alpha amylase C-terminal domain-containing protein [Bacteroidales bacterium]|nr:alpha amylase C-terminal domain-containing protein [Bacteroidales bacterium]
MKIVPEIVRNDSWLQPYAEVIVQRLKKARAREQLLLKVENVDALVDLASQHHFYGLHKGPDGWVLREWAPNATALFLIGPFNQWQKDARWSFVRVADYWQLDLPGDSLRHGDLYRIFIEWEGGSGDRVPAWCHRAVQDEKTKIFSAQVWAPDTPYLWKHEFKPAETYYPLIYEAHIGMAQEEGKVGTYREFQDHVLPRVISAGYNTLQLMAVQEHPYYGSFGYHVANFFAPSSRFGTPDALKELVDAAHGAGLRVIMDIVHSHAVKNEIEGLSCYDGTTYQFFHDGPRGEHPAWDSRCFDYSKRQVFLFLLSNCRYWMEEFRFDGFRFDGVTSMVYLDHGLGRDFGDYSAYFDGGQDEDALIYLMLANRMIHQFNSEAVTIAEEMSGMPGMAASLETGGIGFDYRLAMGIPDYWIRIIKEKKDEAWNVEEMYYELTRRRNDEQTIGYCESHDQALVGDKTIIFRLIDKEMYTGMSVTTENLVVDRGIALHKMIRMMTLATAGHGYLNFMGNEFGHPEWIDFPRQGNHWSYQYARRQWSLADNPFLRYHHLRAFDQAMIALFSEKKVFSDPWPYLIHKSVEDQVLAFRRKQLLFVFNFSPSQSYTDYAIEAESGKYRIVLSSDFDGFGGFNRVDTTLSYFTMKAGREYYDPHVLKLYIPNRVVIVMERVG